jgi:hypothetical protein
MLLMSTPSPGKNQKFLQTGQTKPYADPCKDGEEKALGDHRRPRDLTKLSRMSLRRQDRIRIRSKKYRNHTSEGDSQRCTMLGVSVSISNVSARAQSIADVGGGVAVLQNLCRPEVELTIGRREGKELSCLMERYSPCGEHGS